MSDTDDFELLANKTTFDTLDPDEMETHSVWPPSIDQSFYVFPRLSLLERSSALGFIVGFIGSIAPINLLFIALVLLSSATSDWYPGTYFVLLVFAVNVAVAVVVSIKTRSRYRGISNGINTGLFIMIALPLGAVQVHQR